jgi:DNA-binding winged helix-turn-helix (wHTH) protein
MNKTFRHIYRFGPFQLDEQERRLTREGNQISLTLKAFDTLLLLVQHSGCVLEKREMMDQIWHETYVEEGTLAQNIFTLRRALGEDSTNIQFIETVPRKGYRFIGQVEICNKEEKTPSLLSTRIPAIAVLPFDSLIGCAEKEYLGPGLTDVLVTKLSNLLQITVLPAANTRKYANSSYDPLQVGKELSVDCVLTGSFQRVGTRIRTIVQLINVESGRVVLSDIIDHDSTDVFSDQDLISERVTRSVLLVFGGDCNDRIDGTKSGSTNLNNS